MKFNKNLLKEKWFSYTIALCSAVALYMILTHLSGILHFLQSIWRVGSPVFMAFVIAYVLGPLAEVYSKYVLYKIEQGKLRHTLSVILAVLSVVLFIVILAVALIPQIIDSVVLFAGNLNGYVLSFQRLMRQLNSMALQHDLDLSQFITSSDELLQSITRILPENLNKIVNFSYSFGATMFEWIISFILAIYLMLGSDKLKAGLGRLLHAILPAQVYRNTSSFWSRCNKILVQFIAFDVLDGIIIGLCNWVFMVIMGMPYVAIISAIVGVTNLAPTFGPMVGAIIGAFILVLVKPWYALAFLLFTTVLQTIDGYVIKPRLFGEQLGVSSVWILISLVIGGRLIGVAGILLAIPFAAIADFVYHDYIIKRLEEQNAEHKKLAEAANAGIEAAGESVAEAAAHITGSAVPAFGVRSIVPTDAGTDSDAVRAAGAESDAESDAENGTDDTKDDADNAEKGTDDTKSDADNAKNDALDDAVIDTAEDNGSGPGSDDRQAADADGDIEGSDGSDPGSDDGQAADADDDIEDSGCSGPGSDDGQAADADGDIEDSGCSGPGSDDGQAADADGDTAPAVG